MYGQESVAVRVDGCKRQIEFETTLAKSDAAAKAGDWQNADETSAIALAAAGTRRAPGICQDHPAAPPGRRLDGAGRRQSPLAARRRRAPRTSPNATPSPAPHPADMTGAINFLDSSPRRAESRIVSFCAVRRRIHPPRPHRRHAPLSRSLEERPAAALRSRRTRQSQPRSRPHLRCLRRS